MANNSRKLLMQQYTNQTQNKKASLEEKVDNYLLKNQNVRPPDGKIHPSMIGQCPRYVYFFMKKVPYTNYIPTDARTQRIFDVGKDHEVRVKKRFKAINILVAVDKQIPTNPDRVSGTSDAIVYLDGEYIVVEIKTANSNQFKMYIPHKKYKLQLAAYIYYLDIPKGKLYYSNKDDQTEVEIEMDKNDPVVGEMLSLVRMYNYNFDTNTVPDVSEIRPKCSATSCAYYNQCMNYPVTAIQE